MRRIIALIGSVVVVAAALTLVGAPQSAATPVATTEETYQHFKRVFPDPQGCLDGEAGTSPWAKGDVCAAQFIQYQEALDGLKFLENRFPRYLRLFNLREQFGDQFREEMRSAGLPQEDLSRLRSDLRVVKVTDSESPVPEPDRKHFAYVLSIHGIEKAGLEGGIRAAEELVTWASCEQDAESAPACAEEGPFPKPILEPSDSGPTATETLRESVIYFVLANPDGWRRGDVTDGGVSYQRYNGNGMDLNRDWPTMGYTEQQYTPGSEPETRSFAEYLTSVKDRTSAGRFAGAIDLHGMVTAPSFSFTLLGAGQRDYQRNELTVDTAIRTFRDSEKRLSWSNLIATQEEGCPGDIEVPEVGGSVPMCSDQWGTVWDTINYQVTGAFADWMESPLGLDAVGIDNEMALSHLAPDTVYDPELEQLHIDGNKGLIYSQIASMLEERSAEFQPEGKVGYIFDPERITNPGGEPVDGPEGMPTQDTITHTSPTGIEEFRFDVKGMSDGFFNGGLTVEATFGNLDGISTNSAAELILDYCGPPLHPGDEEGCHEVARYFNQSPIYLQAGARIDLNDPPPGPYRIRANPTRALPTSYEISFSSGQAYDQPEQAGYDVSRMDFFRDLNEYVPDGSDLTAIPVDDVLKGKGRKLDRFDTVVVAGDLMPGFVSSGEQDRGEPQPSESFSFGADAAPLPGTSSPAYEFTVDDGFDNDRMVVEASWANTSDYDLRVERLNPATGEWEDRGCECVFVNTGEQVTVFGPEPGDWRVRVENFLAAPQEVDGTIEFVSDPAPEASGESAYSTRQFERYASGLSRFAARGGNLVLTDSGIAGLPALGTGIDQDAVTGGFFYAGWMDFHDGSDGAGPTYDRHPLAEGVDKEGTAEGEATVDGHEFSNRHQTYEPVPIGYYVSPSGSGNADCDSDRCDSPNWIVSQDAWESAGGSTAARTLVRTNKGPGPSEVGVSLGELPVGQGRIRIAGALLPEPTEQNPHPYGLRSYALTYTGYQLVENLLDLP